MSDELLNIFRDEVQEHLETLNNVLLQVEMISPDEAENYHDAIKEMNRVAHSMKGAARAVGFSMIETISHYMEEVFSAVMQRKLELSPEVADSIYDGLDLIQGAMDGAEPNDEALAASLANLERIVAVTGEAETDDDHTTTSTATDSQVMEPVVSENGSDNGHGSGNGRDTASVQEAAVLEEPSKPTPQPKPEKTTLPAAKIPDVGDFDTSTMVIRPVEETIRVTVSKLDRLMAEVTELFVAQMHSEEQQRSIKDVRMLTGRWQREWRNVRAAYIRLVRRLQDSEEEMDSELPTIFRFLESNQRYMTELNRRLTQLSQNAAQDNLRLSTLADQLQDDIGGMRLMPFETVIGAFQRMVRDLSRDLGKQVNLEIVGASVEIDKAMLDALKDPLLHVLRNSIDHGIEMPEKRQALGKSPVGHIVVEVEQRGSEINIYVRDDGHGIDAARVRKSIVKNGLMSEAEASAISDDEARTYIFYTGLSTADQVTSLSGRGMGMDIVRDRVESLRGRVSVQSVLNEGTTIMLSVPVSLTRIRCIMLRIGEQQFAIPSAMVLRMDKISRDEIYTVEGRETLSIGERPVPVVSMGAILDIASGVSDEDDDDKMSFIALQTTDRAVAFEVDELYSEQELVLKPLGPELVRARYVAGASLLGTGEIIIVLDANDIVRRAIGATLPRRRSAMTIIAPTHRRMRVLVVDDSITTRTLEKNILETAGFEVYVAMDGAEAWSMLPHNEFDVIISDVEMPNMTGLELAARIKSSNQYQHIPVILLTSLGKPEQREAGMRAGANAYLVKSQFDQGELLQTIQSVV